MGKKKQLRKEQRTFWSDFCAYLFEKMNETKIPALYVPEENLWEFAKFPETITDADFSMIARFAEENGLAFFPIEPLYDEEGNVVKSDLFPDSPEPETIFVFFSVDPYLNIANTPVDREKSDLLWNQILKDHDAENEQPMVDLLKEAEALVD